jgi:hypothetical protein
MNCSYAERRKELVREAIGKWLSDKSTLEEAVFDLFDAAALEGANRAVAQHSIDSENLRAMRRVWGSK